MLQQTVLLGALAAAAYRDWKEKVVYLYLPVLTGIAGLLLHLFQRESTLQEMLGGAAVGLAVFCAGKLGGECIGEGDGIMLAASGIYLGFWRNLELFIMALFLAALAALFLLVTKKKGKKDKIPFLPFLLAAYILMLV